MVISTTHNNYFLHTQLTQSGRWCAIYYLLFIIYSLIIIKMKDLSLKTSWWKYYIIDKETELIIAEFKTLKEAVQFTREFRKIEKETERTRDGSAMSQRKI